LIGLVFAGPASPGFAQLFSGWSGAGARPLVIDFLDIGQGDSILIRSPEGKTALVDAGPSRDAATKLLKRKGITALDIVIVSHHHSDHYGGMDQVIRNFKPKYFMATGSSHTTKNYLKLLQTVRAEGTTAVAPTAKPRKIELGSVL
jgi:beta-lactamase superfamily II metal-dependent hydrolase